MKSKALGTQLIFARYVIPVVPAGRVLENHAVAVSGGQILDVMPNQAALRQWPEADCVQLPDHALIPGLVNAHTHTPMTLLRGYADDLDLHVWLQEHIWPAEQAFAGPQFVTDGSRLAIAEMIRGGTTCFNDMYFFPDSTVKVCLETGMRATIGIPVIEIETPWASTIDEYLQKGVELIGVYGENSLIDFTFSPHAPYTVCDETLMKIKRLRDEMHVPVNIHLLETNWDIKHSLQNHDMHPLVRLEKLGLLDDQLMAVHMTQLSKDDIRKVAENRVHVVHCPQSNLKLASGICPLAALLAEGVNVALGTDGAASNNDLDLFAEAQTAALLAKGISGDATAVSAFQALEMMTINGAKVLGKEKELGSIEAGKQADLCAVDLSQPETQPLHNIASQLVYAASRRQVSDVWVAGKRLLQQGVLTTIDIEAVVSSAREWQQRLGTLESQQAVT